MRLLLVEDEPDLITYLQKSLKAENFAVDVTTNGEEGSFLARTNPYDLVILDNTLPKKNGQQICQEIRASQKTMPIIILSAIADVQKKISLLNAGADDYLNKPFSFGELLARIKALLRRNTPMQTQTTHLIADLEINHTQGTVFKAHQEIILTKKEFQLLDLLSSQPNRIFSRAEIIEHVWDRNADPFSNIIEHHIANVRKKIDPDNQFIITVIGEGYKFKTNP